MAISLQRQINDLSAKVTALTMLVEALYADQLARADHPAAVAQELINSALDAEKKAREAVGESDHALRISEALTSSIDRARERAQSLRRKGFRG
jgi:hypothetical protein